MGLGLRTASLPASSFATGSGVLNLIRQIGFAIGVSVFIAIVGAAVSMENRITAFRMAWWAMVAITLLGLLPLLMLRRRSPAGTIIEPSSR